jgi:hypothetical protein
MSERQIAMNILESRRYLSKNVLSRELGVRLKDSGKILESLLPIPGFLPIYARCKENQIKLETSCGPESIIYAIVHSDYIANIYGIEWEVRRSFQNKTIVYPPADSGIYIQAPRILSEPKAYTPVSTAKPLPKPLLSAGASRLKTPPEDIKNPKIEIKPAEPKNFEPSGLLNSSAAASNPKQKTISFSDIPPKSKENIKSMNPEILKPIETPYKIETPVHIEPKADKRKDTPYPNKTINSQNFLELTLNPSIYTCEENDEDACENPKNLDSNPLKRKSNKPKPEKKIKTGEVTQNDKEPGPAKPIITKKKVYKQKQYVENGRIVTEDYSSEEEVIIYQAQGVMKKNQGKQMTLNFISSSKT